jgi:hypothetical protein
MKNIKINVFEQIGSDAAVASEDGEILFQQMDKALVNDMLVILDFINIGLITPTFLNASVGQLYSKYESPFLKEHLRVDNMPQVDLEILKKVVSRAKEYFKR